MATIVQDYGPIYGEVVNGTVQGRPNGSIYVPISNTLTISLAGNAELTFISPNRLYVDDGVLFSAQSQDLASSVSFKIYSDAECTTEVGTGSNLAAGTFSGNRKTIAYGTEETLTPGTTYYIRAALMNNGTAVAYSEVLTVVCPE